jgi:hypothetical protein
MHLSHVPQVLPTCNHLYDIIANEAKDNKSQLDSILCISSSNIGQSSYP